MARPMGYRAFSVALLCLLLLVRGAAAGDARNPFGPKGLRFGYSAKLVPEMSRADAQAALELWGREFVRLSGYDVPCKLIVYRRPGDVHLRDPERPGRFHRSGLPGIPEDPRARERWSRR